MKMYMIKIIDESGDYPTSTILEKVFLSKRDLYKELFRMGFTIQQYDEESPQWIRKEGEGWGAIVEIATIIEKEIAS